MNYTLEDELRSMLSFNGQEIERYEYQALRNAVYAIASTDLRSKFAVKPTLSFTYNQDGEAFIETSVPIFQPSEHHVLDENCIKLVINVNVREREYDFEFTGMRMKEFGGGTFQGLEKIHLDRDSDLPFRHLFLVLSSRVVVVEATKQSRKAERFWGNKNEYDGTIRINTGLIEKLRYRKRSGVEMKEISISEDAALERYECLQRHIDPESVLFS